MVDTLKKIVNLIFFEKKTFKFVGKEGLNDWHLHIIQGKKITSKLLMDPNMIKVHSYLTHAGLKPGVVKIKERQIPGVEPGLVEGATKGLRTFWLRLI